MRDSFFLKKFIIIDIKKIILPFLQKGKRTGIEKGNWKKFLYLVLSLTTATVIKRVE